MIKKTKVKNTSYKLAPWLTKIPKHMTKNMFGQYLVQALSISLNALYGIDQNGLLNREPISKYVAKEAIEQINKLGDPQ